VLERIGGSDDAGIENRYIMAKYGLEADGPRATSVRLDSAMSERAPLEDTQREDLSDLAFVSIDAARTQDIDDALYAEVTSDGWILYVAIADPTPTSTPTRRCAISCAGAAAACTSTAPWRRCFPRPWPCSGCALAENEARPALVCRLQVSEDGSIGDFRFLEAKVRSGAKLSYYAVDRYLSGHNESLICHATPLEALYQASRALRRHREEQELVMEDRQEYRWVLDERVTSITSSPAKNSSPSASSRNA
jgi:exoribonuclease II